MMIWSLLWFACPAWVPALSALTGWGCDTYAWALRDLAITSSREAGKVRPELQTSDLAVGAKRQGFGQASRTLFN